MLKTIITGGFLAGSRTYILGFLLAAQAVANWAVGDATLVDLITAIPEILAGLGFMSLRAAIGPIMDALKK